MTTGCLASASLRTGWRYVYLCICICPFCIWNANFVFWQVTCWILYSFLFRFALGHGTPSWRSGTKQEDFEFPKKIQLVTQFSAAIGTDTKFHDLKKRYSENCRIQIWNDDSFKSGKAAFSKTCQIARLWVRLPGSVCFGWNDFDTLLWRILGFEAVVRFARSDSNKGSESLRVPNFWNKQWLRSPHPIWRVFGLETKVKNNFCCE